MRSSSGYHFVALDHVRAVAAFMVFAWHFTHGVGGGGSPVHFNYAPVLFPLSLLDEGHTGVALFMTLSGYLFAKLLNGKAISYHLFLWNRALRLLPLLFVMIFLVGIKELAKGREIYPYLQSVARGAIFPTLPQGGWSITVECHYYLILPIFLWLMRRSKWLPIIIIVLAIIGRCLLYIQNGEIQSAAYLTIIGRVDQFAFGMLLFQFRSFFVNRHALAISIFAAFVAFYWLFDIAGGFYNLPSYPSPNVVWIALPTIEGATYATLIAWYDSSFLFSKTGLSKFVGLIGTYSYSIYLLHMFIVFHAASFINTRVMDISNFYIACLWSAATFILMVPIGYVSYRYIESPFLKLRTRYINKEDHGFNGAK
jgi:peptidoglycan/LPS O-acetylase OafA/YrhL